MANKDLRILYWISLNSHRKICLPMNERDGVIQAIVMPKTISSNGFQLKNIYTYNHSDLSGVVKVIDEFKPDVFVQCTSSRYFVKALKKRGIKQCFSAHGVWPKSTVNKEIVADPFFQNFDLFCGASHMFEHVLRKYGKIKSKIALDALVQFDVLHKNMKVKDKIRNNIIKKSNKPDADKLITLFGHKCTSKSNKLLPYNYGYFRTVAELEGLAKKHNWLICIKPKGARDREFIKTNKDKWSKIDNVKDRYLKISNSKHQQIFNKLKPFSFKFGACLIH